MPTPLDNKENILNVMRKVGVIPQESTQEFNQAQIAWFRKTFKYLSSLEQVNKITFLVNPEEFDVAFVLYKEKALKVERVNRVNVLNKNRAISTLSSEKKKNTCFKSPKKFKNFS